MKEFLDQYRRELYGAVDAIAPEEFQKAVDLIAQAYREDRQIFVMGNGGSAATANHFVCNFGKNAVQDPAKRRFRMLSLSDNVERITAYGNDVSFEEIFRQQLVNLMNPGDLLISISASGNSPDLVRPCQYARERGARQIAMAGFDGGKIREFAQAGLVIPLSSYEWIEDGHMILCHMIVCYFKSHQELLG